MCVCVYIGMSFYHPFLLKRVILVLFILKLPEQILSLRNILSRCSIDMNTTLRKEKKTMGVRLENIYSITI